MTRINYGLHPAELHRKHLQAEKYELTRIPTTIKSGKARVHGIPPDYRLGVGHVKFFYDKLKYLHKRYKALHDELISRGYNSTYDETIFQDLPEELYNDSIATAVDRHITKERVNERLSLMRITKEELQNSLIK